MRTGRAIPIALFLLSGCTLEQILIGQWYNITTPAAGACPSLRLQFVVDPRHQIAGHLSTSGQQRIADLSGVLHPDDSFQITAAATTITGRFTAGISTIAIHGDAAGPACDGQTFSLPLGRFLSRQGGGGGGGG